MQLVTTLASDETARTAYVQLNDDGAIGTDAAGTNARHTFVGPDADGKVPDGSEAWKGSVAASLAAVYPGAEFHTPETLNAKVAGILVAKGLRVKKADGTLITNEEQAWLVASAAVAKTASDAAATNLATATTALKNAQAALAANTDPIAADGLTGTVTAAQQLVDDATAQAAAATQALNAATAAAA
jgi:hypothetical protein